MFCLHSHRCALSSLHLIPVWPQNTPLHTPQSPQLPLQTCLRDTEGNHPRMLSRNLIILQQVRLRRTETQSPGYSSWRGSTHPCKEKTRASLSRHPIREGGLRDLVSILRVQVEHGQREGRVATGSLGGETRRLPPPARLCVRGVRKT